MLKIVVTETPAEKRWTLHGQLVGPWVRQLRICWRKACGGAGGQKCVVNLDDVTFIDKAGEKLLRVMAKEGIEFVARGISIRYLVEELSKTSPKRNLSKPFGSLLAGVVAVSVSFLPSATRVQTHESRAAQESTATQRNSHCLNSSIANGTEEGAPKCFPIL